MTGWSFSTDGALLSIDGIWGALSKNVRTATTLLCNGDAFQRNSGTFWVLLQTSIEIRV